MQSRSRNPVLGRAGEPLDTNHANAWALFCKPLHDGRSATDHMFESIAGRLRA